MKRRLLIIAVFLLLGAVWSCCLTDAATRRSGQTAVASGLMIAA